MARWTKVITTAGAALVAAAPGKAFNFTQVKCGSTDVAVENLAALTTIPGYVKNLSITSISSSGAIAKLRMQLNNNDVASDFQLRLIGIYAKLGTSGTETLFEVLRAETPDTIPSATNSPNYVNDYLLNVTVQNASSFSATIDSAAYVTVGQMAEVQADITEISSASGNTAEALDTHKLDKANPHGVTASQVGLGNVDNTADKDKPISDAAKTALDQKANAGESIPAGGTTGQVLKKTSNVDYEASWGNDSAGLLPQIIVSVTTGSTVTCTNGTTTLTGTAASGKATFNLPNYGTWTVSATLSGQTSSEGTLAVDSVKQYSVTLSYFIATLTVTAEVSAQVTATDGTHTYTGTCDSTGKCALILRYAGAYTVTAVKNSATSSAATANVTTSGNAYTATVTFITLTVTIDSGSTVTATNGSTTLTASSTSTAKFYLPNTGTWNVSASLNGETAAGSVACSAYTGYALEISYIKVFGVMWNYGGSSTALSRLTKTGDPNGLVTVNITSEPVAAVGTGSGSSPFDSYAPWSGMDEYNIISNAVSYKKGDSGFSRTSYDTMVFIPEYYFKIVDDSANSKRYFYVADKAKSGFTKHPGSGKYVARYNTISGYYSKSSAAPLASITRAAARTNSAAKGSKWSQYDFASWCAVWLLYLVEFADWNSQTKVGRGYVDGSAVQSNGGTDSMTYYTGRASGTDGTTQVQYRHIENPWGNIWEWIDGINFNGTTPYICTTPANYADDTATNYTAAGVILPASGWITNIGVSGTFPWSFLPTANGGSETTYIPDYVSSSSGWLVLMVSGSYGDGSYAGLFYFYAGISSSGASTSIGARLLFHP